MKTMNAHINVDIEYDYIIYNGSNADDVFKFAKDHGILCRDENEPFVKRPESIPNLNRFELLKWWESTGEMKPKYKGIAGNENLYNTHNTNNMPLWDKDEDFYLSFNAKPEGYCWHEYFTKGKGIIVVNKKYCIVSNLADDEISSYVVDLIKSQFS